MRQKDETKEEFCVACGAIPFAIAGAGVAGFGSKKGSNKKMKTIMLCCGLGITLVSIIIVIIYLKSCKSCR